jgi:endonuclease/exonuclease/phosphatase (EEP) superfamily protein YafD
VRTILREWDGERIAIIAGDMNAAPADLEMSLLAEAGFGDLGEPAGATTALSDPPRRIDYIWAIGLIGGAPRTVPALSASDHLPLVVNVTRPSRP